MLGSLTVHFKASIEYSAIEHSPRILIPYYLLQTLTIIGFTYIVAVYCLFYWHPNLATTPLCGVLLNISLLFVCRARTVMDRIFALVQEIAGQAKTVKMSDVLDACTGKGFKPSQVEETIEDYEGLNVWHLNQTRTTITFV